MIEYWVRPKGVAPDVLFALLCGDVSAPATFGVNRSGWAPTVQLTAYLRALPADGWLRIMCTTVQIGQDWFDEDHIVVDCEGHIVVQSRQLAMVPPARSNAPCGVCNALTVARIAIIGGGSIGEALLSGLLRAGRQVKDLVVAEKDPDRAKYLSETYSVLVTSVADAAENASFVIVAVKPADVTLVIDEIADAAAHAESDSAEQVFVTVAAGVTTDFYEAKLPAGAPVVRVMPNAPVVVGGGVSALAPGRFATAEQLKEVSAIFDAVGGVLTVPESQMDAVTALSGSGPAYFFLVVEALVDAGVAAGLSRPVATDLVVQTMAGSAAMLLERLDAQQPAGDAAMGTAMDTTAAQLRATVTSPGGTTAAGLRELERGGLRAALADGC